MSLEDFLSHSHAAADVSKASTYADLGLETTHAETGVTNADLLHIALETGDETTITFLADLYGQIGSDGLTVEGKQKLLVRARTELAKLKLHLSVTKDSAKRRPLQARLLLCNYILEVISKKSVAEAVDKDVSLESSSDERLKLFNSLLASANIKPLDKDHSTIDSYSQERKRIAEAVEAFILSQVVSELRNVSDDYMVNKNPSLWDGITIPTGLSNKPQYTLLEWINSIPGKVFCRIGSEKTEHDFLPETQSYLVDLITWVNNEGGRAAMLTVYKDPQAFSSVVEGSEFKKLIFDKKSLEKMLTRDREESEERKTTNSAYRAFRRTAQIMLQITSAPEYGSAASTSLDRIKAYEERYGQYNPFPLAPTQGDPVVVSQMKTFSWVNDQLLKEGYSNSVIELAFRLFFAHSRSTGLEEYFDLRPHQLTKTLEDGSKELLAVAGKVRAVRPMTRVFHSLEWAKYSVESSKEARDPVAIRYVENHPAFGLPASKIWFCAVKEPDGTVKRRSVFEILKQGKADSVLKTNEPGSTYPDPSINWGQHIHYATLHYEALFMGKSALKVLPDPSTLAEIVVPPVTSDNNELATKLAKFMHHGQFLDQNDRTWLLERLHNFDKLVWQDIDPDSLTKEQVDLAKKCLLYVGLKPPAESPTSAVVKDGCDYYWDNTPPEPEVYRELFASRDGGEHTGIMDAVRTGNKPKFSTIMFYMLVKAELERYSISSRDIQRRAVQWERNQIDYVQPVQTTSKSPPLNWAQRRALEMYIDDLASGFHEGMLDYQLNPKSIQMMFENLGLEKNRAVDIHDLQWLLVKEPDVLKKKIRAIPAVIDNPLFHLLANINSILAPQKGVT